MFSDNPVRDAFEHEQTIQVTGAQNSGVITRGLAAEQHISHVHEFKANKGRGRNTSLVSPASVNIGPTSLHSVTRWR